MTVQVGVTGTRKAPTREQYFQLRVALSQAVELGSTLHHGACVGVDLEAHVAAWAMGYHIVVHPPTDPKLRAWVEKSDFWDPETDVLLPELPYLERNLKIVEAVDLLIVVPDGPERERSGTWSTYRAAKRLGVPTSLIPPTVVAP